MQLLRKDVIRRARARRSARAPGAPEASSRSPPNGGATEVCSRKERSGAESASEQGPDNGERREVSVGAWVPGTRPGRGPENERARRDMESAAGQGKSLKGEPLPHKLLVDHVPGPRYFDVGRRADV